jgi:hypothetical protein
LGTAGGIINDKNEIRLYLKGDDNKNKAIAEKIQESLPSVINARPERMPHKSSIPKGDVYSEFKQFDALAPEVRALILTAL